MPKRMSSHPNGSIACDAVPELISGHKKTATFQLAVFLCPEPGAWIQARNRVFTLTGYSPTEWVQYFKDFPEQLRVRNHQLTGFTCRWVT